MAEPSTISKNKFYSSNNTNNRAKVLFPVPKKSLSATMNTTITSTSKKTPEQQYRSQQQQQQALLDSPSRVAEVDSGHDESLNSSLNSNLNTTVGSAGNQEVLRMCHVRSAAYKKRMKNQKKAKKKFKKKIIIQEKLKLSKEKHCREIKLLESELANTKSKVCHLEKMKGKQMVTTSQFKFSNLTRKDLTGVAKSFLIKQLPSSPPSILSSALQCFDEKVLGKGTFGTVVLGKLPHITTDVVAVKTVSLKTSNTTEITAELRVLHALSGHPSFPYCYGIVDSNKIVMQFIGDFKSGEPITTTIQSKMGEKYISASEWGIVCFKLCQAIKYLHSLEILHNDIKANNVILRNKIDIKVIDFGKATSLKKPFVYNLSDQARQKYNSKHRYLAHELRNFSSVKQSVQTDCYSVGYLIKYIGYYEKSSFLHELGRKLKATDLQKRLTLEAASECINAEIPRL